MVPYIAGAADIAAPPGLSLCGVAPVPGVLRVALVQPVPVGGDPASRANPGKAAELILDASRFDPDLIAFPEYFPFHETEELVEAISDVGAYVVAGIAYREGGSIYNTATIYKPDGTVAARQGKRYVGRLERRLWGFTGWPHSYVVVDIGKARLGVAVCADFWSFPEAPLELFLGGADVFVNPAYMFSLQGHWLSANLSRALDFYMPVIGVDLASFPLKTKRYTFTGGGLSHVIVPPSSEEEVEEWWASGAIAAADWVRVKLHTREAISTYEIDVQGVSRLREDWWDRMRGMSLAEWMETARRRHAPARILRA